MSVAQAILEYLGQHTVVTLATAGPDPYAAAVYYANDGFQLVFVTDPTTLHGSHLVDSDRVAGTIQDQPFEWADIKGIQLRGRAVLLEGRPAEQARSVFITKYPYAATMLKLATTDVSAASRTAGVRIWRLVPEWIRLLDNSKGFGHKDELLFDHQGNPVTTGASA
jgi:uncharacterized protein YhbP (UPF0306 family)